MEVNIKPATKPNAPQNLVILVKNGRIVISWQSPSDNGGDSIICYKIYRGTSSGNETFLMTISNLSSFTDTTLINGQPYYYRISAENAMGESVWSAEVVAIFYPSEDGDPQFSWIIIILMAVGVVGISGCALYFNRKIKSLEGKITGPSQALTSKKPSISWKPLTTESFEVEEQIRDLPLLEDEKKLMLTEFQGIENDGRIAVFNSIRGNLSEDEANNLWDSILLRFNRLCKSENWAQALISLEELFQIADFLGDNSKFNDLLGKYDEIQEKLLKNSVNNETRGNGVIPP